MANGFYWGANNPYLRSIWFKVRRIPKGLSPNFARIGNDANPAHIIFECLTNRDWGMGSGVGSIDVVSFETCGQTLYDEEFGLSLQWTRSTTIEAFITEIIDHIHATLFVNPRTGLITLKLLREDFDYDSLRIISPSNARLSNFQRKMWGETSNEIVVTWTNPENEQEETVAMQDIANVAMQGGVISNGRNYYGIRNKDLAARVAARDLRASAMPLATVDVELNRSNWDVVPGEVVKITWPEKGIVELVARIGVINYGRPGEGWIKTTVYEDVFSLAAANYLSPSDTQWENPSQDPTPLANVSVCTAPAALTTQALGLNSASQIEYPEVVTMVLAAVNTRDDIDYELIGQVPQPNGTLIYDSLGTRPFIGGATLALDIPAESETLIEAFDDTSGGSPLVASILMIGDGTETGSELVLVKEVTESGWTLTRGILDTTPIAWESGTRIWTLPGDLSFYDTTLRADTETVEYRLLTRTSNGVLTFDEAEAENLTLTGRPHYPLRPANVKVNGVGFGTVNVETAPSLTITWANRNRLTETTQYQPWDAASVTGEVGQTTSIIFLRSDRTEIGRVSGLTGTSYVASTAQFTGQNTGIIRVISARDGFESLQGHEIALTNIEETTLSLSGESGIVLLSGDAQSGTGGINIGVE